MKIITEKIYLFLIPSLFTFPLFKESISSAIIILLVLNTILYHFAHKIVPKIKLEIFFLTIPFWIVLIHSLIFNQFLNNQVPLQHALFFLIIPLCFTLIPIRFFDAKSMTLYFSILKNTCLIIGLFYITSYFYYHSFNELFVVYQNVSSFRNYVYNDVNIIKIHPTYYTTILILCCIQSFESVINEKKYFEFVYILFFIVISFLLLAKLNIVFLVIVLLGMQLFRSQYSLRKKIILTFFLSISVALLIALTPGIKSRFVEIINSANKPPQGVAYDSTNIRKAIFDCSISLLKTDYVHGVGFGNLQERLNTCYEENYNSDFYRKNQYMTHNYYFYILISSGIFGFLFFVFYAFQIIKIGFQLRYFIFTIFLVNIFFVCLIEDFIYRHYGVLYFNLLLMCFIQYSKNGYTNSPNSSKKVFNISNKL
jgi:O-antigen ligase